MHEHDIDVIMALAEETLGDTDALAAEAAIAACSQCTADLALQRSALAIFTEVPRAYLTATESARLREAVRSDLHLAVPERRAEGWRKRFPLGALAGAAAVLIAVVIAAPALNLLGTQDDDSPTFNDALAPPAVSQAGESAELAPIVPEPAPSPDAPARAEGPELSLPAGTVEEGGIPTLKSDTNLEELRALFIAGQDATSDMTFNAIDGPTSADPATDPAAPPPPVPVVDDPPLETVAGAPQPQCDLDTVPGITAGSESTILAFMEFEGTPAIVVAFVEGQIEDARIVVLSIETCEVLGAA
jgi:hypothetical protein